MKAVEILLWMILQVKVYGFAPVWALMLILVALGWACASLIFTKKSKG